MCAKNSHQLSMELQFNTRGFMLLQDWLDENCLTISEFSKRIGIPRKTIHTYLKGHKARRDIAFRIQKFTSGQVNALDLLRGEEGKENDLHAGSRRPDSVEKGRP